MAICPRRIRFTATNDHTPLDNPVLKNVEPNLLVSLLLDALRPIEALEYVVGECAVEPLEVDRVEAVFLTLEPVAWQHRIPNITDDVGHGVNVPVGQQWCRLGSQIRHEQPGLLAHRVCPCADLVLESTFGILFLFVWLLDALACIVVAPAVVVTA